MTLNQGKSERIFHQREEPHLLEFMSRSNNRSLKNKLQCKLMFKSTHTPKPHNKTLTTMQQVCLQILSNNNNRAQSQSLNPSKLKAKRMLFHLDTWVETKSQPNNRQLNNSLQFRPKFRYKLKSKSKSKYLSQNPSQPSHQLMTKIPSSKWLKLTITEMNLKRTTNS